VYGVINPGLPGLPDDLSKETAESIALRRMKEGMTLDIASNDGRLSDMERAALTYYLVGFTAGHLPKKEYRLILPLAPGVGAEVGQVILSRGSGQNAKATLVGRGLPLGESPDNLSEERPSQAGLRQKLKQEFRLYEIRGNWGDEELLKVYRALALTDSRDRGALLGVNLERVRTIDSEASFGHTLALFSEKEGVLGSDWGTIHVADEAFAKDDQGFYGGTDGVPARPPSFQAILHEVGHAIASVVRRYRARDIAEDALRSVGKNLPERSMPLQSDEIGEALQPRPLAARVNAVSIKIEAAIDAVEKKLEDADRKIQACEELGGLAKEYAEKLRAWQVDPHKGREAGELFQRFVEESKLISTVMGMTNAVTDAINRSEYGQVNLDDIIRKLPALNHEPWIFFHEEISRICRLRVSELRWRQTYLDGDRRKSGRERRLDDFVREYRIARDLTPYAARSAVGELYAEAYSLWRIHPETLAMHDEKLRDYFVRFDYLKGDD
jgi:hypothetical protein